MNTKDQAQEDKVRIWIDYEASMTLSGCVKRFHRNNAFVLNLQKIFGYLCKKFETLCNLQRSCHIFINQTIPEAHLLSISQEPNYRCIRLSNDNYSTLRSYTEKSSEDEVIPPITELDLQNLGELLEILDIKNDVESTNGFLIPFNYRSIDMGVFVLWGHDNPKRRIKPPHDEALRWWLAYYYTFLQTFLSREYALFSDTYLPSYYSVRWGKAAILFADIRNFTPLTEILRNVYARLGNQETRIFREIMDKHCREMARIIQENGRGRIDKFMGDGVMAVFGEHESNPSKAVCRAAYAASQMVKRFGELKTGFLKKTFDGEYETEYNESVEIELGVGIDYGTVLFEYLGDERHREYTAVGDHVNFAQRLETEAARVDEHTNTVRPPILVSPTAERCIRPWLKQKSEIILYPKGKGRFYRVYGISPEDFDRELYLETETTGNWRTTPWRRPGCECGPPQTANTPDIV